MSKQTYTDEVAREIRNNIARGEFYFMIGHIYAWSINEVIVRTIGLVFNKKGYGI